MFAVLCIAGYLRIAMSAFSYDFGLVAGDTAAGSSSTASGAPPNAGKSGGGVVVVV